MLRRLGYVAMALGIGSATNRTCRLAGATPERLRALIASNLRELEAVLQYNAAHGVGLYRVSSELIPFASHPVNAIPWWDEHAADLERMAAYRTATGQRLTMHPGQFTVLNSPRAEVVKAAILDLQWHARLLDLLGMDGSGKIVIHVGGAFGDKRSAADRFVSVARSLPESIRRRLVVENDEHVWSAEEVLDVSARTGLPMIFDNLHDRIRSRREDGPALLLRDVFATWRPEDGVPKIHFSSQAVAARPGAHSDFISAEQFVRLLESAPGDTAFDCMLECKMKDIALLRLRAELAGRGIRETGLDAFEPALPPPTEVPARPKPKGLAKKAARPASGTLQAGESTAGAAIRAQGTSEEASAAPE